MKKGLIVCLAGLMILALAACSAKTAMTDEEFRTKLEPQGFEMYDATEQFGEQVQSVTVAMNGDYQVEFYVMPSVEDAQYSFELNKGGFEEAAGNASVNTSVSAANYSTYTLSTSDAYMVVSRVENTFIYCDVDAAYKSDVEALIKDMGY